VSELLPFAGWAWARLAAIWARPEKTGALVTILIVLALTPWLRRTGGREYRGYVRPAFVTDLAYAALYLGGVYGFFVGGPLHRVLLALCHRYAPLLEANLLAPLPPLTQFAVFFVTMDGVTYWTHRLLHASPLLWAFHGIHHSQAELSALTYLRFHVGDMLVRNVAQFAPALVLGNPAIAGIPFIWVTACVSVALEGLAHADLGWTYGPAGAVLVSPAFHRIHHSVESRHYNRNFGAAFSFWDRLFGTGERDEEKPRAYGNADLGVPVSFLGQLFFPFLCLARRASVGRAGGPTRRAA
jgi:sterol desaturase/sphingolipid hydroxylase (fatty acid hydroxylase superfamily)